MNGAVYKHIWQTYGQRSVIWFGLITEVIRSLMLRVWVAIIMAQTAASLATGNVDGAKHNALLFLAVYTLGSVIGAFGEIIAVLSENNQYELSMIHYHSKLTGKDMAFYRDHQSGYLVSLFRQYLDSMLTLVRFLRTEAARAAISLGAPVVVMFVINWKLGLVSLFIVVVQLIYITWSSGQARKYRAMTHEIYRQITGEVADEITNIVAFKSGGVEKQARSRITELSHQETRAFWLRRKLGILYDLPRDIITAIGITSVFYVVFSDSANGSQSVGLIVLTLTYMFQIMQTVSSVPTLIANHDDLVTKAYPTLKYLGNEWETIVDPEKPQLLNIVNGRIEIDDVTFCYPSHSEYKSLPIFQNLSVNIRGGEQIGIVGLSGAGKSTLANLLMRFDEVDSGTIRIDGIDIRDVSQSDLHRQIAYVPQEPLLFHKTIRENIAYFNSEASEAEIIQAAKAADAHDFITSLPDGYNSLVGDRGVKLSGGQKQRVVIARAILKNAPIIIFDEATSALDSESEKIIQSTLPEIIGKHTAIVIAHRLSTLSNLDRILVMHNGQIVEEGKHIELIALGGRYASLWRKQTNASPL